MDAVITANGADFVPFQDLVTCEIHAGRAPPRCEADLGQTVGHSNGYQTEILMMCLELELDCKARATQLPVDVYRFTPSRQTANVANRKSGPDSGATHWKSRQVPSGSSLSSSATAGK